MGPQGLGKKRQLLSPHPASQRGDALLCPSFLDAEE